MRWCFPALSNAFSAFQFLSPRCWRGLYSAFKVRASGFPRRDLVIQQFCLSISVFIYFAFSTQTELSTIAFILICYYVFADKWRCLGGVIVWYTDVLLGLIRHAGLSYGETSRRLQKSPSWARNTALPKRDPKLSTVADVADVCGVDVKLVDRETGEIVGVVDPPHKGKREG